jgi:hypothetical protein
MSESAIIVAELSVSAQDAARRASALAEWLLHRGIIQVNAHRDPLRHPSQYIAGPNVIQAAPGFDHMAGLHNNGVDIMSQRQAHDPGGNYEPPTCPTCGNPLDEDTHFELIGPWLDRAEPEVTCTRCNSSALLGDWPGQWAIHVANLAARFNNWPALADDFTRDLGDRLGPRSRLIFQRT